MKSLCYNFKDLSRAIADNETRGEIKVLTPPGKDKILGVTIAGEHAGDLITEFILAMQNGLGLNKVLGTIHIYPTLAESARFVGWKLEEEASFRSKHFVICKDLTNGADASS